MNMEPNDLFITHNHVGKETDDNVKVDVYKYNVYGEGDSYLDAIANALTNLENKAPLIMLAMSKNNQLLEEIFSDLDSDNDYNFKDIPSIKKVRISFNMISCADIEIERRRTLNNLLDNLK